MSQPRRALVIVDVQGEYFSGPLAIQYPCREDSLARILHAIDVAQSQALPIVIVRHESAVGAQVFAAGSPGGRLHPMLAERVRPDWKEVVKRFASAFDDTDMADWCARRRIDTLTLAGYMTNNCILATAAAAAPHGLAAEVLSDATGAINLANEVGCSPARLVHETLMTLLHSSFAAVATTDAWATAVRDGVACARSDLISSATAPVVGWGHP